MFYLYLSDLALHSIGKGLGIGIGAIWSSEYWIIKDCLGTCLEGHIHEDGSFKACRNIKEDLTITSLLDFYA